VDISLDDEYGYFYSTANTIVSFFRSGNKAIVKHHGQKLLFLIVDESVKFVQIYFIIIINA
jgi:hypothetical protein